LDLYSSTLFGHAHALVRRGQFTHTLAALGELEKLLVLTAGDTQHPFFDTQHNRIRCARTRVAVIESHPPLQPIGLRDVESSLRVDGSFGES
jgi:hypothetical protein